MIPYKQLTLVDFFADCQEKFENDKPAFLTLLETHINLDEIIPVSFKNHFYASTGRTRKYPLQALLWALIIQRIFSIPTNQLLLVILQYSKPLRDFCGFTKEWDNTYKIRTAVERDINHLKENLCLAGRRAQNAKHFTLI